VRHREILTEQKKKFVDYVERPSKYMPEPTEPLCLSRKIEYFKNESIGKSFGYSTHTTWEGFQNTLKTKSYQEAVQGSMFGKSDFKFGANSGNVTLVGGGYRSIGGRSSIS
jgi:hypothetical protein